MIPFTIVLYEVVSTTTASSWLNDSVNPPPSMHFRLGITACANAAKSGVARI
jgi:hypothetical protein